jgi:hypothetical protein
VAEVTVVVAVTAGHKRNQVERPDRIFRSGFSASRALTFPVDLSSKR